jgi:hypothetical protein
MPAGSTAMISTERLFLGITVFGARNYVAGKVAALGKHIVD